MVLKSISKSTKQLIINPDEVHVWAASLARVKDDIYYFSAILSKDECERADSFKDAQNKLLYICARGILRCILARYLGTTPQSIEFIYGLWGKPGLLMEKPIHFNISHSRDYVLFALTRDYEVGIDIEFIDKQFELESLVTFIFSSYELDYWRQLSLKHRAEYFFKIWTCKEAYLKSLGKGWVADEHDISCKNKYPLKIQKKSICQGEKVSFPYVFESVPGYASALFVNGPPLYLRYHIWDPLLINDY